MTFDPNKITPAPESSALSSTHLAANVVAMTLATSPTLASIDNVLRLIATGLDSLNLDRTSQADLTQHLAFAFYAGADNVASDNQIR